MKQPVLLILNTLTLIFALVLNSLQGSVLFDGVTVGEISNTYNSLIAPAGYAFAIWGIIYLMLILFVVNQWVAWYRNKQDRELKQTGIWFAMSNMANGLWIVAWLNGYFGLSVIIIFILLLSLIVLTIRLKLEVWNAPMRTIAFVWWPITIYLGWIVVASVANVAVWLVSMNWNGGIFTPVTWTIIMIGMATLIYLSLIFTRNMREAALVGIWAFIAIAMKHWNIYDQIVNAALIASVILFIAILWHAFKNRKTLPHKKLQHKEF